MIWEVTMFCSNCGSEIADGSKFCSECGARINSDAEQSVHEHKVVSSSSNRGYVMDESKSSTKFNFDFGVDEPKSAAPKKKSTVSFDWSSVIDESHKKQTKNIRSPWDSDYQEESNNTYARTSIDLSEGYRGPAAETAEKSVTEPVLDTVPEQTAASSVINANNTDSLEEMIKRDSEESVVAPKGRTLNFIEVMKQEKEEREREAKEVVVPQPVAPQTDEFDFDELILPIEERENTQGYTDLKQDIIAELSATEDKEAVNDRLDAASDDFESYINARHKSHEELFQAEPPQSFAESIKPAENEEPEEFKLPVDEFEAQMNDLLSGGVGENETSVAAVKEDKTAEIDDDDLFNFDIDIKDTDEEEDTVNEYLGVTTPSRVSRAQQRAEELEDDIFTDDDSEEAEDIETFSYDDEFSIEADELETDLNPEPKVASSADILENLTFAEGETDEPYTDDYLNILEPAKDTAESESEATTPQTVTADIADSTAIGYEDAFNEPTLKNDTDLDPTPKVAPSEELMDEFAFGETELDEPYKDEYLNEAAVVTPAKDAAAVATSSIVEPLETKEEAAPVDDAASIEPIATETPVEVVTDAPIASEASPEIEKKSEETKELEDEIANLKRRLAELTGKDLSEAEEVPARDVVTAEELVNEPVTAEAPVTEAAVEPAKSSNLTSVEAELAALGFDTIDDEPDSEMIFAGDDLVNDGIEADADALPEQEEVMSIDELQKDLFGTEPEDASVEATRKIDKFYTLYRKNEEFQQLLDEEYKKLQNGSADYTLMDDVLADYDDETSEEESPEEKIEAHHESVEAVVKAESAKLEEAKKNAGESLDGLTLSAINSAANVPVNSANEAAAKAEEAIKGVAPKVIDNDDEESKGGILTVIAVIVAILLVLLLVVILILNFAPDSAIAQKLSEMIGNFTNFAALNDGSETLL